MNNEKVAFSCFQSNNLKHNYIIYQWGYFWSLYGFLVRGGWLLLITDNSALEYIPRCSDGLCFKVSLF